MGEAASITDDFMHGRILARYATARYEFKVLNRRFPSLRGWTLLRRKTLLDWNVSKRSMTARAFL